MCEGPRKINLLHLVPCIVDSAFTISERSLHCLLISHTVFTRCKRNVVIWDFCTDFNVILAHHYALYLCHCVDLGYVDIH